MKKGWILSLLGCLAVLSAACGHSSQTQSAAKLSGVQFYPTSSIQDSLKLIASSLVTCADPLKCSPSVGMLMGDMTLNGERGVGQCTAWVVSKYVVATNSHCVDQDLREGRSCEGTVAIKFPRTAAARPQVVHCAKILSRQGPGPDYEAVERDFAFLEVKEIILRPPLKISHGGVQHNQVFTVHKVDPGIAADGSPTGTLVTDQCRSKLDNDVVYDGDSPNSPGLLFIGVNGADNGCNIQHGNSGSPLIADDGQVHALIQAQATISWTWMIDVPGDAIFSYGTNLACVPSPLTSNFVYPSECLVGYTHEQRVQREREKYKIKVRAPLLAFYEKLAIQNVFGDDNVFHWKMSSDVDGRTVGQETQINPVPSCINKNRLAKYKGFFGYSRSARLNVTLSTRFDAVKYDRNFKLKSVGMFGGTWNTTIDFSPVDAIKSSKSKVAVTRHFSRGVADENVFDAEIPACP